VATLVEATPEWQKCLPVAEVLPPETVPVLTAFENRLKAITPYFPVTVVVLALNVLVFGLMALNHQRVVHFNADNIMSWGGAYAPKTFEGDWWRPLTSTFVHGGLGHLTGNLFFLLLIGPLIERLLGSTRFAVVYLFAGVGAALIGLGMFPTQPACGASGAVYGLYGALLGCYLRGLRAIPARIFLRNVGLILLFALVNLLQDYLELERSFSVHAAGLVFGFTGGLLFGHVLGPRRTWHKDPGPSFWRPASDAAMHSGRTAWLKRAVFPLVTILCCGLLLFTASVVRRCSGETLRLLGPYAGALDRERQLVARYNDALDGWECGDWKDADLRRELNDLVLQWERLRTELKLKLPDNLGMENRPLSARELFDQAHRQGPHHVKDKEPFSDKDFDLMFRLYLKLRLDNWRRLADALQGADPILAAPLLDEVLIMGLRHELNEMANEQNPLGQWAKSRGHRGHAKENPGPTLVMGP
jgi:membrane associated rhomboid family serine protease